MPASEPSSPSPQSLTTTLLLGLAHAVLLGLSFEPPGLWPLAFLAPAPLALMALRGAGLLRVATIAFSTQIAMWLTLNVWVIQVTPLGYVMMAIYLSLYAVAFVWLLRLVSRRPLTVGLPMTLVVPLLWTGLECVRGKLLFDGYPWHLLAQPMIGWLAFVQSADLLGTYFISFMTAMASGLVVDVFLARGGVVPRRRLTIAAASVALLLIANLAYGVFRLGQTAVLTPGPRVLVIQTNLAQDNKIGWPLEQQLRDFDAFLELTIRSHQQASVAGRVDLVVWPETMLPGFGLDPETERMLVDGGYMPGDHFSRGIVSLHRLLETPLLVGSPSYQGLRVVDGLWEWDTHFNSAYLIEGRRPFQRYDKHALTPFGERMPYISAWPWLEERLLAIGAGGMSFDLDAAPEVSVLELPRDDGVIGLAVPICYEDAMPDVCRRMVYEAGRKRAHVLVNLSNDGWFGWFDGGRAQHNQIARFRCIENRVPMVRSVNTGQTVAIDSRGKAIAAIGRGRYGVARQDGFLVGELALDARRTLFGRWGDVWAWACLLAALGLTVAALAARFTVRGGSRCGSDRAG